MINTGNTFIVYWMNGSTSTLELIVIETAKQLWWCKTREGFVVGFNSLSPNIKFIRATAKEKPQDS